MLDSSKDLLSRQRLEVLVGMVMTEPIQKAAAAQKNAFAGVRLQPPYPMQIVRKGGQKRSIRIILFTWNSNNEPLRSHSPCVS
ncbi:hypothetical protein ACVMB2_003476 [Sinorhizobium meliloti]